MRLFVVVRPTSRANEKLRAAEVLAGFVLIAGMVIPQALEAQTIDCGRLQQQIAQSDRGGGNRYAAAARRQSAELARTQAYAQQLGCGGLASFFGGNPQCGGLNQRIQQMQANLGQLQAASGGGGQRADLVARYNAYCRGGSPQPQQPRGFFESLFGGQEQPAPPLPDMRRDQPQDSADDEGGPHARGGSQAVCVRTCDGGFFPLGVSARRGDDSLNEMCTALCPGTQAVVFTRTPSADIRTAMGIDGKPYMDLPNALKYSKTFTPDCSCRPAGKSWAEALANAEEVIGHAHKGDIVVTPEKSDELSRPKLDSQTRSSLLQKPATAMVLSDDAKTLNGMTPSDKAPGDAAAPSLDQDAVKPGVRQVGPQP